MKLGFGGGSGDGGREREKNVLHSGCFIESIAARDQTDLLYVKSLLEIQFDFIPNEATTYGTMKCIESRFSGCVIVRIICSE